jgi:hypothetical protein
MVEFFGIIHKSLTAFQPWNIGPVHSVSSIYDSLELQQFFSRGARQAESMVQELIEKFVVAFPYP